MEEVETLNLFFPRRPLVHYSTDLSQSHPTGPQTCLRAGGLSSVQTRESCQDVGKKEITGDMDPEKSSGPEERGENPTVSRLCQVTKIGA